MSKKTFIEYLKTIPYNRWNFAILKQLAEEEEIDFSEELVSYLKETPWNTNWNMINNLIETSSKKIYQIKLINESGTPFDVYSNFVENDTTPVVSHCLPPNSEFDEQIIKDGNNTILTLQGYISMGGLNSYTIDITGDIQTDGIIQSVDDNYEEIKYYIYGDGTLKIQSKK